MASSILATDYEKNAAPAVVADRVVQNGYESSDSDRDEKDMSRLGKKQEFRRTFGFWSTMGFTSLYIATWEYLLVSVYGGLVNGGFGGLVYEYIGTTLAYTTVVLSLAEMSSIIIIEYGADQRRAPTSGGQYHWVSEFAPANFQRVLSYAAGWTICMGWLVGAASGYYITSTLMEALVEVYLPDWGFTRWQATLVMFASVVFTVTFNTVGARALPAIERLSLFGHIAGWVVTVACLWAMAPKNSAHQVFEEVVNSGGWASTGGSCLIGTVTVLYCQLGPDAAVHIAEEVRDASITLPRCIVWGYLYNAVLGFVMLITMLFTVGDLDSALNAASPFQNAFTNTGSKAVNTILTLILFFLILSGNIVAVTTTSREAWAFARDRGFPFSRWIAKVNTYHNAPLNAVYITTILSVALCCINFGSNTAFQIVISLNLIAFLATYLLSIGCLLHRRIYNPASLPPAAWSLGRWGIPINLFACVYSTFALVLSCFPTFNHPDAADANWGPAIFAGVLLLAVASWLINGSKTYHGPVVFVEGRRLEDESVQRHEWSK